MTKETQLDLIPFELNKRYINIRKMQSSCLFTAYTFDEFVIICKQRHSAEITINKIYYQDKFCYGIKIANVHGKVYYNYEWVLGERDFGYLIHTTEKAAKDKAVELVVLKLETI